MRVDADDESSFVLLTYGAGGASTIPKAAKLLLRKKEPANTAGFCINVSMGESRNFLLAVTTKALLCRQKICPGPTSKPITERDKQL